jgi:histidine triad (HIT) family protein
VELTEYDPQYFGQVLGSRTGKRGILEEEAITIRKLDKCFQTGSGGDDVQDGRLKSGDQSRPLDPNCDFCQIILGMEPADIVCETDRAIAFAPLSPATTGHTLVVPKHHVPTYWEATQEDIFESLKLVRRVALAIRSSLHPAGLNVLTSAGKVASQTVFHLHWHVLPRYEKDAVGEFWPERSPLSREESRTTATLIRAACTSR